MSTVIVVPPSGQVQLRTQWRKDNREWVKSLSARKIRLAWVKRPMTYLGDHGYWSVSRDHLAELILGCVSRYETVDVWRKASRNVRCDVRCVNARGPECVCSCGGANHRGSTSGYRIVSDSTLVSSDPSWVCVTYCRGDEDLAADQAA